MVLMGVAYNIIAYPASIPQERKLEIVYLKLYMARYKAFWSMTYTPLLVFGTLSMPMLLSVTSHLTMGRLIEIHWQHSTRIHETDASLFWGVSARGKALER